ncbi:MAG: hypothetical protein ACFFCZ_27650 [Promethearchaeota archaeon]
MNKCICCALLTVLLLFCSTISSFDGDRINALPRLNNNRIYNPTLASWENNRSFSSSPAINGENIAILVNSDLYTTSASIRSNVTTYIKDLNDTGYITHLYTDPIPDAFTLRKFLQQWYNQYNLSGAVLIGSFPYVKYYHPQTDGYSADSFICDLYLMDLDGSWFDQNNDGVFDLHEPTISGSDIYPEIYISRIDATHRTFGGFTNEENINNLLTRSHSYRVGGIKRKHRALIYIDDDWELWANGTYDELGSWSENSYTEITKVLTPSWTNASNWLNQITHDYQWGYLGAHSTSKVHYFGSKGVGEGTVTSAQIDNVTPSFNFYELFCCHAAQWTDNDCLATTYLFGGSHSLAVVGSTKAGGILEGSHFYEALGQNKTIGYALHKWFENFDTYTTNYLEWFYGVCILGDPFLTLHYDVTVHPVTISSPTHPDPDRSYASAYPQFNWTVPTDVNGIVGYYYLLDQNKTTIPTSLHGNYISVNGTRLSTPLYDGTWYLHVVAVDGAGNVGKIVAHFQVKIDNMLILTQLLLNPFFWLLTGLTIVVAVLTLILIWYQRSRI